MATKTAPQPVFTAPAEPAATPEPALEPTATDAGFLLDSAQLVLIEGTTGKGKPVTPSKYAHLFTDDSVKMALSDGLARGIKVTLTSATQDIGQLDKAVKHYNTAHPDSMITVQKWNRKNEGFIGYKVIPYVAPKPRAKRIDGEPATA